MLPESIKCTTESRVIKNALINGMRGRERERKRKRGREGEREREEQRSTRECVCGRRESQSERGSIYGLNDAKIHRNTVDSAEIFWAACLAAAPGLLHRHEDRI